MIKKVREIIASPIILLSMLLSFIGSFIYGKGFEDLIWKIASDIHKIQHGHDFKFKK